MIPTARTRAKRRVARVVALWGGLALSAIALLGALAIWHIIRRGRVLREGSAPPRPVDREGPT